MEGYISIGSRKARQEWSLARAERFKQKILSQLSVNKQPLAVGVRLATGNEFSQALEKTGIDYDKDDYWIILSEIRKEFLAGDLRIHQNLFEEFLHALENDRKQQPDNVYVLQEIYELILTIQSEDGAPLLDHKIPELEMSDEQIKKIVEAINAIPGTITATVQAAIREGVGAELVANQKQHDETIAALKLLISQQQQLIGALTSNNTQPTTETIALNRMSTKKNKSLIGRIKSHWEALTLIALMVLSGGAGVIYIGNAISEAVTPLYGPPGYPEQGLIMDVKLLTGYTDKNGNKVKGKIDIMNDEINAKMDKILKEQNNQDLSSHRSK